MKVRRLKKFRKTKITALGSQESLVLMRGWGVELIADQPIPANRFVGVVNDISGGIGPAMSQYLKRGSEFGVPQNTVIGITDIAVEAGETFLLNRVYGSVIAASKVYKGDLITATMGGYAVPLCYGDYVESVIIEGTPTPFSNMTALNSFLITSSSAEDTQIIYCFGEGSSFGLNPPEVVAAEQIYQLNGTEVATKTNISLDTDTFHGARLESPAIGTITIKNSNGDTVTTIAPGELRAGALTPASEEAARAFSNRVVLAYDENLATDFFTVEGYIGDSLVTSMVQTTGTTPVYFPDKSFDTITALYAGSGTSAACTLSAADTAENMNIRPPIGVALNSGNKGDLIKIELRV